MEATARKVDEQARRPEASGIFAPALPTLTPGMLIPRAARIGRPFPLDDPGMLTFYFARNGVYALARLWNLSGKEVLFPAYFHGVELEALLEAGVRPRFYPVHAKMRVDPREVIDLITKDTAAVYLIHYAGFPGPVEELAHACRERNLPLIEDCALALLSSTPDQPLGTYGDAAIFCFYKTVPVPNGGALVLRRPSPSLPRGRAPGFSSTAAHAASSLLQGLEMRGGRAGRAARAIVRAAGGAVRKASGTKHVSTGTQHFDRNNAGLAMSSISKVVLAAQDFAGIVERRRRNYFHLLGQLRGVSPPVFGELAPGVCPLFYPLVVKGKRAVMARLHARGVEAIDFWRVGHPAVPPGTFPAVDKLRQEVLEIPCHQDLDPAATERVARVVREVLEEGA